MKKIIFKLTIACLGIISGSYLYQQKKHQVNDIALENIEALANEESSGDTFCYGIGSIDCLGRKVEMKFTGVR